MGNLNCSTNACCAKEDATNTLIDDLKESGDKDSDDCIEIKREINKLKNDLISVRSHNVDMSMDSTFECANDLLQYKKNESKKYLFIINIYGFIF
jgi:hypothetical protein